MQGCATARRPCLRFSVRLLLTLTVLLGLLVLQSRGQTFSGTVVGVKDGDTIDVLRRTSDGPRPVTVRLHGVDTPESRQPFGTRAEQFTANMVFQSTVAVTIEDTDRYGRTVGVVKVDGRELNAALVQSGMAWWDERYAPNDRQRQRLQRQARASDAGLWSRPGPIPPWDWYDGDHGSARRSADPRRMDRSVPLPYDPDGPDRDCGDFSCQRTAQAFFESAGPGDPHRLGGDDDGVACESL